MDIRLLFILAVVSFASCTKYKGKRGLPPIPENSPAEEYPSPEQEENENMFQDQSYPSLTSHIIESYIAVPDPETSSSVQGCNKWKNSKEATEPSSVDSDLGESFLDVPAEKIDLGASFVYVPGSETSEGNLSGQGTEGNPSGQGTEGNPSGQGTEGNPSGQGTEGNPSGQGTEGNPSGQGTEENPSGLVADSKQEIVKGQSKESMAGAKP